MEAWKAELYHHGILGMKWGVRRFQNYDGSYTRRGLNRYNRKVEEYENAKQMHKFARLSRKGRVSAKNQETGEFEDIRVSKGLTKDLKRQEKNSKQAAKKAYKDLKLDYKADQGKELYRQGVRINANARNAVVREIGVMLGSSLAAAIVDAKMPNASVIIGNYGSVPASVMVDTYLKTGGTIVNAALTLRDHSRNDKLRAYYAHSTPKD